MAIPKTVCKACRQGLNWELCDVEEKNTRTLCIERREECKSTMPSSQLGRLPTVSAYPNIQFPPNQTPSHPVPASSWAQTSSLLSASDGSYSSYTSRPIHPGMHIAGSVKFYSGLGGHQHSDARASTIRQTQPTTREPAFPVQPQCLVSNPGPLAHNITNQNSVSIFTVANWDKDSNGFWTCLLDTSGERSCLSPGPKARFKEDIISHCISEHWGYNAMQSQRILLQCMKGLSLDDVIELYSDYQRFEKAYGSFRTMWIKWSRYSKRHDNLSPWNSKMEEAARHMLDKTQTEKVIECGPSTLDDSNRTFKDSDALEGWQVDYAKVGNQAS